MGEPFYQLSLLVQREQLSAEVPVEGVEMIKLARAVKVQTIEECPFFGRDGIRPSVLDPNRMSDDAWIEAAETVRLIINCDVSGLVADGDDGVVVLEHDAFSGEDGFQTNIRWREDTVRELKFAVGFAGERVDPSPQGCEYARLAVIVDL